MTVEQKIIKNKLGVWELARQLGNVSQACKVMGFSRDSFYRFKELYETGLVAHLSRHVDKPWHQSSRGSCRRQRRSQISS